MYQRTVLLSLPKFQTIDIEFTNITYETRCGFRGPTKRILDGVSGSFKSGQLTAIMGPSGAGKSTLLNILTGFQRDRWKGEIEYIGNDGKQAWNEYRKQSCYIQQDDKLRALFTVWEAMWMAANLKIGASLSRKAKEMLIDDLLESLDLSKTKQTRCNLLSGGQKKRLSIALELMDNPPVMFLDEPTTGLDSLSSHQCIRLLHGLAAAGRTIVCTIHQPDATIYEMFDHVYLLAGGRCMYEGASVNTVAYFSAIGLQCPRYHNPADFMIEVVSMEYGDFSDQLAKMAAGKEISWRLDKPQDLKKQDDKFAEGTKATVLVQAPSELERFFVLLKRSLLQMCRDWTLTHLKIALNTFVGILLGLLFTNAGQEGSKTLNNVGFFLVTCTYLCYTSMMPAVLKFPTEYPALKTERFNNWYQLRTYYVASLVCSVPMQIIFAFVYSSTSYILSSQPMEMDRFAMYLLIAILTGLIAESFGLLVGTLVNPVNGTFLGAIITCTMLLLTGFLALYSHMPVAMYYGSYLSYLKYALHGLVQAIYGFGREKLSCSKSYCHYRVPDLLLEELWMADGRYWLDVILLICNFVLMRLVTYFVLKKKLSMS